MSIEAAKLKEEEKKKKIISEKEKTFARKKSIDLSNNREKWEKQEYSEKELFKLRNLLEDWNLDESTKKIVKKVVESDIIWEEEIKEIFEKIDEIENNDEISKYLPENSRITKEEYKKSLTEDIVRKQTLTKLKTTLTILANHINPDSSMWLNLFSGFMTVLDKNLITIQETHIDIKDSLEKIEEIKNPKEQKTFWEKIIIILKELIK
jgi:hypothetical protein